VTCDDARILLHAHLDGELDVARDFELTKHIEGCADCTREFEAMRALRSRLRSGEFHFATPEDLEHRIRRAIAHAPNAPRERRVRRILSAAAPLAIAAILLILFVPMLLQPALSDRIADEVVASHVRSLMGSHLTDVVSTDKHTVKPWFAGKLDFSPIVVDFASDGFKLVGGRLDYIDDRPVAAVVYQHGRHLINLFMWPAGTEGRTPRISELTRMGYNVVHFRKDAMECWLVSDMQASELERFAGLIQSSEPPAGAPEPEASPASS
jgi:anti-sigma factor RsiW